MTLFNKILIANRGEIACRIIRTAKRLGINTVSIFSEIDKHSMHVSLADEAYCIGPAPSKASYLNTKKIIEIAKEAKVDAIHPGYGFLSENSDFVKHCEKENIVFVGPSSTAIELMANKNVAKDIMDKHGVPILPGYYDNAQSPTHLFEAAKTIEFPVVLKAIAGGGGKGLRLVEKEEEFESAYHAVKREALAFFNDDKILVEKYLSNARHVEVQILADHQGNVRSLFTRDCSIQRRHQKIVEEAPAPNISLPLQEKMMQAGIAAAKAINYTNAGTIEFLLEGENFYFMEMNTRLQVEHPVTEMITGIDLVEWQLRIAAKEALFSGPLTCQGHAIEVRLNAEDPDHHFLPSSGYINYFQLPPSNSHQRIDSGYQQGDEMGIYYDSLLAKLIVWDENRSLTIHRLQKFLNHTLIFGIKTNLPLLKSISQNDIFMRGEMNTHFLQLSLLLSNTPTFEVYALGALFQCVFPKLSSSSDNNDPYSPWLKHNNWRLFTPSSLSFEFKHLSDPITIKITPAENAYIVQSEAQEVRAEILALSPLAENVFELKVLLKDEFLNAIIFSNDSVINIHLNSQDYQLGTIGRDHGQALADAEEQLTSPMPGTVVALHVTSGQKVSKGEKLIVIEAMKMEHTLLAPKEGIIKTCYFKVGDLIKEGAELIEYEK